MSWLNLGERGKHPGVRGHTGVVVRLGNYDARDRAYISFGPDVLRETGWGPGDRLTLHYEPKRNLVRVLPSEQGWKATQGSKQSIRIRFSRLEPLPWGIGESRVGKDLLIGPNWIEFRWPWTDERRRVA